jgi:hypothetical protein
MTPHRATIAAVAVAAGLRTWGLTPGYADATGGNAQGGIGTHSGFKTDPSPGIPCDARLTRMSRIDPQTGNAVGEIYGPPGCDPSLPNRRLLEGTFPAPAFPTTPDQT